MCYPSPLDTTASGPLPPEGHRSVSELLDQLMYLSEQTLDEAQICKQGLYTHRMRQAMFSVLCQVN